MTGHAVFVSGASGFLGSRVVPELLASGNRVRGLARSERAAAVIAALGAEPIAGDLADLEAMTDAMKGCDLVLHLAARFREGGSPAAYYRDNVVGTEQMLAAAQAAGVRRFVMVGAAMCLLGNGPIENADESWPLGEPRFSSYARTKTIADRTVLRANRDGFTTCVVRPAWVWGPGDPQGEAVVEAARKGQMRLIDGGVYPIVTSHIENTVRGVTLALERGRGGEAYYVFDDGLTPIGDFIGQILAASGLAKPTNAIPRKVAWVVGSLMDAAWTLLRRQGEPPVSRLLVALNGGPFLVSDAKARRELGYSPVISRKDGFARLTEHIRGAPSALPASAG